MKIAFLFPGQGSQLIGMGKDLYEEYEDAQIVYNEACDICGTDIKKILYFSSKILIIICAISCVIPSNFLTSEFIST